MGGAVVGSKVLLVFLVRLDGRSSCWVEGAVGVFGEHEISWISKLKLAGRLRIIALRM